MDQQLMIAYHAMEWTVVRAPFYAKRAMEQIQPIAKLVYQEQVL